MKKILIILTSLTLASCAQTSQQVKQQFKTITKDYKAKYEGESIQMQLTEKESSATLTVDASNILKRNTANKFKLPFAESIEKALGLNEHIAVYLHKAPKCSNENDSINASDILGRAVLVSKDEKHIQTFPIPSGTKLVLTTRYYRNSGNHWVACYSSAHWTPEKAKKYTVSISKDEPLFGGISCPIKIESDGSNVEGVFFPAKTKSNVLSILSPDSKGIYKTFKHCSIPNP